MKNNKKFLSVAVAAVLILSITFMMSGCGKAASDSPDSCMKDLASSVEIMIDADNDCQEFESYDEYKAILEESAAAELEVISKYEAAAFDDKEFGQIVSDYVEAAKSKNEGTQYIFDDPSKFNEMYYENGRNVQIRCINDLMDNYDFDVDEDHSGDLYAMAVEDTKHAFAPGETVELTTDYGKVKFRADGYTFRTNAAHQYEEDLLCEITNESYGIDETSGYMDTTEFLEVYSQKNQEILQAGGAFSESVNGYDCHTGFEQLAEGDSEKMAIAYVHEDANDKVMVLLQGTADVYMCILDVE